MTIFLLPFFALAVAGLLLSLVAHTAALLGLPQPLGPAAWALHVGIFVVFVPAIIASRRLDPNPTGNDNWKVILRGCPPWARWLTTAFFVYAVVNFLLFFLDSGPKGGAGAAAPPQVFRGFSGHWMAFYSASAAILYSALVVGKVADSSLEFADRLAGPPGGAEAEDYDDLEAPKPGVGADRGPAR